HNQKGNDQARIDIQTADGSDGHITADISERQSSCASNLDLEIWDPTHQAHIDWASLHGNGQSTATASRNVRVENCQSVHWNDLVPSHPRRQPQTQSGQSGHTGSGVQGTGAAGQGKQIVKG